VSFVSLLHFMVLSHCDASLFGRRFKNWLGFGVTVFDIREEMRTNYVSAKAPSQRIRPAEPPMHTSEAMKHIESNEDSLRSAILDIRIPCF
jgi:hypothetical protein